MFSQYFGNYLLEQDLLTPTELRQVLNKKNNLKLMQKSEHCLISQVLVEEGYFTPSQVNTILDNYRAELGLSRYDFEALKNNDFDKAVDVFAKLSSICDSTIFNDYLSLFVKNVDRFIDNGLKLGLAEEIHEYDYKRLIFQNISGEMELFTGFASDDAALLELGCRFSRRAFSEVNDFILSSAGEFINLQNGVFLSSLSEEGTELDLQAQAWKSNGFLVASGTIFKIPIQLSFGKLDFFISNKIPQLCDKKEMFTAVSVGRGI